MAKLGPTKALSYSSANGTIDFNDESVLLVALISLSPGLKTIVPLALNQLNSFINGYNFIILTVFDRVIVLHFDVHFSLHVFYL